MRRRFSRGRALWLALLLSLPTVGCTDDLPTVTGADLFPGGNRPATFEVILPAERYLRTLGDFRGFAGPRDAGFLVVAHRFDGALEANALAEIAAFPTTVSFTQAGTSKTDSVFTLLRGNVLLPVDTSASTAAGTVRLQVWEIGQAWHPASATWQLAVDTAGARVPWRTPGGTRGALLGELSVPSLRAADTLRVPLDSLALKRIARAGFPGLLVTATGAEARLQLSRPVLVSADVRPKSAAPDTTLNIRVGAGGTQTFIFTPDPPTSPTAWEAGGIASARTLFRVDLGVRVPACAATGCPELPLREVTLNEVSLLLQPVPVPLGFRPLGPMPLRIRRVAEPELGRQAPLGAVVNDAAFVPGAGPIPLGGTFTPGSSLYVVPITRFVTELVASDSATAALALLGEPPVASFGVAWFAPSPRLRIVYTVSERPSLP
jgi:hypothetical protein